MALDAARLLQSAGLVSGTDLRQALELQSLRGGSLPRICHEMGVLDELRWARTVAKALGLPTVDLTSIEVDPAARGKAPEPLLREIAAFPFQLRDVGRTLVVAMAEPQDDAARAQLKAAVNCELKIGVAGYRQVALALERYPNPNSPSGVGAFLAGGREGDVQFESEELGGFEAAPLEGGQAEPAFVDAELVETSEEVGEEVTDLTEQEERLLQALEQNLLQSTKALKAALQLCLAKKLFSAEELAAKLDKKG